MNKIADFPRRIAAVFVAAVTIAALCLCVGCGNQEEIQPEEQVSYEIALVTDDGLINDGGHSEAAWNAITRFGAAKGISHKYYKAVESSEAAYNEAVETAVNNGAKIVIADGYDLGNTILTAQDKYEDVEFVLIDSEPVNEKTGDIKISKNAAAIEFNSQQAGFLAGYAAVVEGYGSIGFIGESSANDSKDFGFGFVKGADMAASQAGDEVEIRYLETSAGHDKVRDIALEWYDAGSEVILACGQDIDNAVIEAAEAKEGKVIAGISDKNQISDAVITSAFQNIDGALTEVLDLYGEDKFPGGEILTFDASNDGIGLAMKYGSLESLTNGDYNDLLKELATGDIKLNLDEIEDVRQIELRNTTIL